MLAVNIFANDIMLINYYITIIIIFAHDSEKTFSWNLSNIGKYK